MGNIFNTAVVLTLGLAIAFAIASGVTAVIGFWFDYPLTIVNILKVWGTMFVVGTIVRIFYKGLKG